MKIQIITSLGTFTSDEITDVSLEDLQNAIKQAATGDLTHIRMSIDSCPVYFAIDMLKNSVFKIIK